MSDAIRQRAAVLRDFSGGLNNFWDPSVIADNEVPELRNMEFSPSGALTSRPPIFLDGEKVYPEEDVHFDLLGFFVEDDGTRYAVYTSPTKTYIYDFDETWTEIWDHKAADFVQYQGYIIMCRIDGAGAYWGPNDAQVWNGSAWVAGDPTEEIATLPAARGIELHRERLFAFGPLGGLSQSYMYWSKITGEVDGHPERDWRYWEVATDFASVNSGDGQWITAMVAGYNDITIFRNNSTFRYTFSGLPEEGVMSKISDTIGAENQKCVVSYENLIFTLSGDKVYGYFNGTFDSLNDLKVRFEAGPNSESLTVKYALSLLGQRLIVHYSGNIYVAQLKTGTWATWTTDTGFAYCKSIPGLRNGIEEAEEAWVISNDIAEGTNPLYRVCDHMHPNAGGEEMQCFLRTKIYDFQTPHEWKRLYWWGAEVMAVGNIKARAYPVDLQSETTITWDQLQTATWDTLEDAPDGWDDLIQVSQFVNTDLVYTGVKPQRLNLKLDQAIRFRRVYFELYLDTDGTDSTAPAQIFNIAPMIGAKAKISERIS